MTDAINPQGQPDFNTVDAATFEALCVDAFRVLPDVESALLYKARAQYGIDALIMFRDGRLEAAEFKRYEPGAFSAAILQATCERFLYNAAHWRESSVSALRIVLSSELRGSALQELAKQRLAFKNAGFDLYFWNGSELYARIIEANAGSILQRYFRRPLWEEQSAAAITLSTILPHINSTLLQRQADLSKTLGVVLSQRLDDIRKELRAGRIENVEAAITQVQSLRSELPAGTLAEWLRFEAVFALRENAIEKASLLAEEAAKFDPESHADIRLRARLEYEKNGPESALRLLENSVSAPSLQLKATLHLSLSQVAEANDLLQQISERDFDAETFRLKAIIKVSEHDYDGAEQNIAEGLRREPDNAALLFIKGVIAYLRALVQPYPGIPGHPEPIDWVLVREDEASVLGLHGAYSTFDSLLQLPNITEFERELYELWRLGSAANLRTEQNRAAEIAKAMLNGPASQIVVVLRWVIERAWDIDISPNIAKLEAALDQAVEADWDHVLAVCEYYLSRRESQESERVLYAYRNVFDQTEQLKSLWALWLARTMMQREEYAAALSALDTVGFTHVLAALSIRRRIAEATNDFTPLTEFINGLHIDTPLVLFECCDAMARAGQWSYVADRAQQLVEAIPNETAVLLAATALYNDGRIRECGEVLAGFQKLTGRVLSEAGQRLQAFSMARMGQLVPALEAANKVAEQNPNLRNKLALAHLAFQAGDRQTVVRVAREVHDDTNLSSEQRLRLAAWLRLDDLLLAQSLWREAISDLADELVPVAVDLAYKLQLDAETAPLMSRFAALGTEGKFGVQAVAVENLRDVIRQVNQRAISALQQYNRGFMNAHMYAYARNRPLSDIYFRQMEDAKHAPNLSLPLPTYVFNGSRYDASNVAKTAWLRADVTALLAAWYIC